MLVMTPARRLTTTSTLYVREYAGPGEVGYFASRTQGAVWVGNVPTPAETSTVLGADAPAASPTWRPDLDRLRATRTPSC